MIGSLEWISIVFYVERTRRLHVVAQHKHPVDTELSFLDAATRALAKGECETELETKK